MFCTARAAAGAAKAQGQDSRVLAAKCALSIRVDALGESSTATIGIDSRLKVEDRLRQLEGRAPVEAADAAPAARPQPAVVMAAHTDKGRGYSVAADSLRSTFWSLHLPPPLSSLVAL